MSVSTLHAFLHLHQPSLLYTTSWQWCSNWAGLRPACSRWPDEWRNRLQDRWKGHVCLETHLKEKLPLKIRVFAFLNVIRIFDFKIELLRTLRCFDIWCLCVTVGQSGTGCPFYHRWTKRQSSAKPLENWARPPQQEIRDGLIEIFRLTNQVAK